jgi:Thoeris protein ThsB, TIR-like domain
MARRVFFSFHYSNDIWRANQVRNCNVIAGVDTAGFFDHSEYEEAKKQGGEGIRRMILKNLKNTSVTVVLIGSETASRPWVRYEVQQSIARKNGLLGIHIHHLKNQHGNPSFWRGSKPTVALGTEFPCYDWDGDLDRFRRAIEAAGKRSDELLADERRRAAVRRW